MNKRTKLQKKCSHTSQGRSRRHAGTFKHNDNYHLPTVLFLVKAMLSVEISHVPKLQVMDSEANLTLQKTLTSGLTIWPKFLFQNCTL